MQSPGPEKMLLPCRENKPDGCLESQDGSSETSTAHLSGPVLSLPSLSMTLIYPGNLAYGQDQNLSLKSIENLHHLTYT